MHKVFSQMAIASEVPSQPHEFPRRSIEHLSHPCRIAGLPVSLECSVDIGVPNTDTVREGDIVLHVLFDQANLATDSPRPSGHGEGHVAAHLSRGGRVTLPAEAHRNQPRQPSWLGRRRVEPAGFALQPPRIAVPGCATLCLLVPRCERVHCTLAPPNSQNRP